ncbi:TPA: hypothetical protein PC598_003420 [Morganella morganii]|uniref:hypothetical protein n=1 Tax=Morganella morganii TaxID=582 RepID=UPI000B1E9AA2|nr:hypothetical protein [Morganella morganii]HDF2343798.1 hypothetical protein [Morganella morganii]
MSGINYRIAVNFSGKINPSAGKHDHDGFIPAPYMTSPSFDVDATGLALTAHFH